MRQYISSIPEPNLQQRGIWTPTRTPHTRAQHRAAAAYLATQQAITASPFAVQTQQLVCHTLYTQGISTVTQTTTPSTSQALTTTETAPTSPPGGITTAVQIPNHYSRASGTGNEHRWCTRCSGWCTRCSGWFNSCYPHCFINKR